MTKLMSACACVLALSIAACGDDDSGGGSGGGSSTGGSSGSGGSGGSSTGGTAGSAGSGGSSTGGSAGSGGSTGGSGGTSTGGSGGSGGASGSILQASGKHDGKAFTFNCTNWSVMVGAMKSYTAAIDVYVFKCRSTDDSLQVILGFPAPALGKADFSTNDKGVALGDPMEVTPLNAGSPNKTANSITFTAIDKGKHLEGSFDASWSSSGGKAADIKGTFKMDF